MLGGKKISDASDIYHLGNHLFSYTMKKYGKLLIRHLILWVKRLLGIEEFFDSISLLAVSWHLLILFRIIAIVHILKYFLGKRRIAAWHYQMF